MARVLVTTEDLGRYQHAKMPNGVAVWDRSRLDQECATEKRRQPKRGKLAQPAARVGTARPS